MGKTLLLNRYIQKIKLVLPVIETGITYIMYRLPVHQSGLAFYFHLGGIPGDPCVLTRFNQYQNWYMCINLVIPVYLLGLTNTRNWDMYMKTGDISIQYRYHQVYELVFYHAQVLV